MQAPSFSFATWFFDYDNDGWPDLFVDSYLTAVDESVKTYLGQPHNAETLKLYRNKHDGTFEDVSVQVGLDKVFMPMGANFGDLDNDGFLDIYLGVGQPSFTSVLPHVLLRNKEGKSFVDITESSGTGELHKGHAIVFADLSRRGSEDIIAEIGGAVPADKHALRVFENPGNTNDWLNVRLVGGKEQSIRRRSGNQAHRGRWGWSAEVDLQDRRTDEFVRRQSCGTEHRAWTRRARGNARRVVACHRYPAALYRCREESIHRNQRICDKL